MRPLALSLSFSAALLVCCDRDQPSRPRSVPINVGQIVEGRLEEGDWTDVFADRSYTDLYQIELDQGQQITVELASGEFDAYLSLLRGPGDNVIDNDDARRGVTDSQLTYRAAVPSRLFIAATTLRAGESGAYTLVVSEGDDRANAAVDAGAEPSGDGGGPGKTAPR